MLSRGDRVWVALVLVVVAFAAGLAGWSALAQPDGDPPQRPQGAAARAPAVEAGATRAGAADRSATPAPAGTGAERARASARAAGPSAPAARPSTPAPAREDLRRAVGQMLMTRMAGVHPSRRLLRRVYRGQVGGVILFADNARTPAQVAGAVAALQRAASRGGNPPLLIAVDQEGGDVRRLRWAPPFPSAAELGADPARALAQGELTARALRRVGINLDLAPVLDVPARRARPLGARTFGRTPGAVARAGCAFATGLRRGGVLAAGKHFPGLGYATANTDAHPVVIRAASALLRAAYGPYRACLDAGVLNAVMVSNAAYPALGAPGPAVLSAAVVQDELRGRLGFRGVVISDTLQARPIRHRRGAAVRAARAGVDLLVYPTTEGASATAYRALLAAGRERAALAHKIRASAQRIRALKRLR